MLDEATSRLLNDAGKVSAHLRRLLDEGKYAEAYAEARKTREERPELPAWTAEAYADCAIMVGRYREAYDDMARLLQNPGYHNENRYLRLSIASAAMGRVVDGQMEYARYWLENAYQYRPGKSSGLPRHIPPSARKVMLVSTLALAAKAPNGGTYYELCLRIDPKCTLAADEAILYYTHKHRDADAKRVAEGMVKALPAGPDRDRFLRHLESAGKRR
jgi:tetratricopeptide (TPR) repeat protein